MGPDGRAGRLRVPRWRRGGGRRRDGGPDDPRGADGAVRRDGGRRGPARAGPRVDRARPRGDAGSCCRAARHRRLGPPGVRPRDRGHDRLDALPSRTLCTAAGAVHVAAAADPRERGARHARLRCDALRPADCRRAARGEWAGQRVRRLRRRVAGGRTGGHRAGLRRAATRPASRSGPRPRGAAGIRGDRRRAWPPAHHRPRLRADVHARLPERSHGRRGHRTARYRRGRRRRPERRDRSRRGAGLDPHLQAGRARRARGVVRPRDRALGRAARRARRGSRSGCRDRAARGRRDRQRAHRRRRIHDARQAGPRDRARADVRRVRGDPDDRDRRRRTAHPAAPPAAGHPGHTRRRSGS